MDDFEKRLKRDADAIEAEVTPQLRARIDASLQGIEPVRQVHKATPPVNLWWASSLTGLAAAVLVIVLMNWNQPGADVTLDETIADTRPESELPTVPEVPANEPPMLDIRTADFTSPLEQELQNLQSDIEKARESVRKDLDFTF
ncbi:MAG: hypothetical protein OEM63_06710 [Gammaproteobacteria bacterium]|nr:hypothetical protein [Gammaproteobacteria bacterium]